MNTSSAEFAQQRLQAFTDRLAIVYEDLFRNDPEYFYSASKTTPSALAHKMALGLDNGTANKDGEGIRRTCKHLGIPHSYKAIRAYLQGK